MTKKNLITDILVFIAILLLFFTANVLVPMLPDWDWYNYRAYNCWAFLNDRLTVDFMASNLRTCINPLLLLPEYFLSLNIKNYYLFALIGNIDISFLMFMVYKIAEVIFPTKKKSTIIGIGIFSTLYVFLSPMMLKLSPIGSHFDVKIALLCILGLYFLLKNLFIDDSKNRSIMICLSGCFFGAATGFKYTSAEYFISLLLIILLLNKSVTKPTKTLLVFLVGGISAFILTGGIWLYYCFKVYHNPVFPYFNDIFASQFADKIRLLDSDYHHLLPKNFLQYILYPLNIPNDEFCAFGYDSFSKDFRWAISYIIVLATSLLLLFKKFSQNIAKRFQNLIDLRYLNLLLLFIVIPYLINTAIFGTYRYILPAYCLFGILIFIFAELIFYNFKFQKTLIVLFFAILTLFVYINCDNGNNEVFKPTKYNINAPVFEWQNLGFSDNSKVLILNNPSSIAIVNQNKNAQYLGFAFPKELIKEVEKNENEDIFWGTYFVPSEYLADLNERIILGNDTVHVVYNEDIYNDNKTFNMVISALDYYNSKRAVKRKLTNCYPINLKFYGISDSFGKNIRCDFN